MTNTELTKIREDRKLSKKEFADLLGVTAMMIGRYEKGTCAIPESIAEKLKEAEDKAVATEIEVKKNTRKAGRKVKEKAEDTFSIAKEAVKESVGIPNIIIQSPMGGYITPADIAKKVPKNTEDVYVRVDENKLYYVLKNGESGDVDIWE
jgi:predicted transcriptional regulator